jgi:hypothetical protein
MSARPAYAVAIAMVLVVLTACSNPFGKQYEYEEQIYLAIDGKATVIINSSIPALVALHGLPLDPSLRSAVDRDQVRRLFATAGCDDVRVGQPWIRRGRRFVQIRVATPDVNQLKSCGPLAWSTYHLSREDQYLSYEQTVGRPQAGDPGNVNWSGSELVGFKLHLPSRIVHHNVKRLEDGTNGEAGRGNILTWEQRLSDRRAGQPLEMTVRMDSESILFRTLSLFAGAFGAALLMLATLIWLTIRRAKRRRRDQPLARSSGPAPWPR